MSFLRYIKFRRMSKTTGIISEIWYNIKGARTRKNMKNFERIIRMLLVTALSIAIGAAVFAQSQDDTVQIEVSIEQVKTAFNNAYGSTYADSDYVQKKVFAKVMTQLLEKEPIDATDCYKDLDPDDEFTGYICALKKRHVLGGLKNKNFFPDSSVTWRFAITTLCKAQRWVSRTGYSQCKEYAERNGILTGEDLPPEIQATKRIEFGQLAYLITRMGAESAEGAESSPPRQSAQEEETPVTDIPPSVTPDVTVTPVADRNIATNFFTNIWLDAPLPNRFLHNEVYFVKGELENSVEDEVFIFLCPDGEGCDNSINFIGNVDDGGRFNVPVIFEAGNYQIGIIPGRAGSSRVADISVVTDINLIPTLAAAANVRGSGASNLAADYKEGEAVFKWNGAAGYTKLSIFQDDQRIDYIFRQNITSYAPPSVDFINFGEGAGGWIVEQNNVTSAINQLNLTVQDFRTIKKDDIAITALTEVFSAPSDFTFSARALKKLSGTAAITLPSGQVEEIKFSNADVASGSTFTARARLASTGTHIFEINDTEGGAVINVPIYVGNKLPLLPDYFATHQTEPSTTALGNTATARQTLLNLINADRAAHGLSAVALSSALNNIAQAHTQNMVAQNFFGHTDASGKGPDDRRRAANYGASVRENLGKAATLELVEAGLMRSPIHRAAIIDPEMKLVGLGIAKDSGGYYIVTQNFSAYPLTANNLTEIENALFSAARRVASRLTHDNVLRNIASDWSDGMASEDGIFGIVNSSGVSLLDTVRNTGVNTAVQAYIVQAGSQNQLEEELLAQEALQDTANIKIGIGLGLNNIGELFMTTIYTP